MAMLTFIEDDVLIHEAALLANVRSLVYNQHAAAFLAFHALSEASILYIA